MLDQIVETMGDASLTVEGFTDVVETGLESIKLGLVPPALDHVLVGSMERTRSGQIRYAFLLGVSDGVIPSRMSEDGVITEAEREWLARSGLTLAPGSRRRLLDERYLIYNAMTAPSEHLWLSYPLADEEGKTLLPSEVIRQVKNLFPSLRERVLMGEPSGVQDEEMQLDYVAEPGKALSYLIVQLREWKKGTPIADFWWEVYNWLHGHPDWEMPLRMLLKSLFFSNQEQQLSSSVSRQLYGDHLRASVSRMERFVACPFSHFASHGLRLQERRIYRLEAPDIGQLFHAALSLIGQKLISSGTSWGALTPDQCRKYAEEAVDELSPRLQSEILLSSKRFAYISRKLKDIVGRASMVLGEQTKRGSFQPLRLEMDFGPNKELPPLTFELSNGCTMEIIGRLDRVDSAETEQGLLLRVIDYKSSQTSLRLDEVYYGLALQLLTYLDVLVTNTESWLGRKAIPAGALYFHVHNPLLQVGGKVPQEVADDMVFKKFKMRGLVLADRDVVRMMDHTLDKGHSSMLPLAVKADGGFYSSASVMTEAQWKVLQSSVRGSIMRIGTEMTNGCVDIAPYRMGTKLPCTFCSYKPVCQFDTLVEGNDYHSLVKPDKDELWQLLSEKGANHNDDDLE
jgi:ATP-dependent helicase/nuclease subunit B